ncbi:MAG: diphosphate--fructose-6-phosphate 1-phosphotransferase, partial [Oscillospiraceae bacterium]|nr:diphosphate--fructose-6-phosphate 1-phosphotransferase [Oscillospiraceae bacterium]
MKNLLIGQSGGPTAAINATLAGVVEQAFISGEVDKIYGARYGIKGVINDNLTEIGAALKDPQALINLSKTPSSALGSCRFKLPHHEKDPEIYKTIFATFARYNIGYFIYIGGNDSMDTVNKLSCYATEQNLDIRIMGAPKTVDNYIYGMDHSPGFGSAARYIATTFSELWLDASVYDVPTITIVETMGRHVGWLCASAALARKNGDAPHLIYMPEIPFEYEKFLEDVKEQLALHPAVVIAISEGIRKADGSFVSEDGRNARVDSFGHKSMGGACHVLDDFLSERIEGAKIRCIDLS